MNAIKPDQDGRVLVQTGEVPEINASLEQASRIASALDAIIRGTGSIGIIIKPGDQSSSLRFFKDDEYLTLRIVEELEQIELEPTEVDKRRASCCAT
jgi:hypothetical protein